MIKGLEILSNPPTSQPFPSLSGELERVHYPDRLPKDGTTHQDHHSAAHGLHPYR